MGSETRVIGRSAGASGSGDLTETLLGADTWDDAWLYDAGIPITEVSLVSVGAGLGSFALLDTLRIAGVPARDLRTLGPNQHPWETYAYLARNSQIPGHERLRSDSASVMDNIWGFPSYAVREAAAASSWRDKLKPLWTVATEPILSEYFTPRADQVFASVKREEARIGWPQMLVEGQVRMVRRRAGGGYFVILTPPEGSAATKRVAFRATYVHIAVGYPGLRFLPDLQQYRQEHQDYARVVNAYEPHDHVYEELRRRPGTVLVRGSGIVASRVLQRLIDDHDRHGARTNIVHLFRNYVAGPKGDSVFFRRPGGDGWSYQGFNFNKAAWGGQTRYKLQRLEGQERADFIRAIGGTNTPVRADWQEQLSRGRREGFYHQRVGTVEEVVPGPEDTIVTRIRTEEGARLELPANYIIDATGLEADIREHRLLADLLDHGGAGTNPYGRLDVERTFEVRGTRSGDGRIYASGTATLGGYYAPVDSFLGLQFAALTIADDLAAQGFGRRIGPLRSIREWWKWVRNRPV